MEKLRSAEFRRGLDALEGGAGRAALMDEVGARRNDSGQNALSRGGARWSLPGVADHDTTIRF